MKDFIIKVRKFIVVALLALVFAYVLVAAIPFIFVAFLVTILDPKVDGKKFDFAAEIEKATAKIKAKTKAVK